jgi:uncharacterized cupredoxin-like copper-binding protein
VSRKIFVLVASMALSLAFLAACGTDDSADDTNGVADDPIGAADEEDTGPIEDDAPLDDEVDDDRVANDDEDDAVVDELDDDAATDDAATEDDDADMNGADDGAVVEELDDEDAATDDDDAATTEHPADMDDQDAPADGEVVEVTLSDYEIEMDSSVEAGEVTFEITNEGDSMHGIAIQESEFSDEDGDGAAGAFLASTTVRPGESSTITVELSEGEYIVSCPVGEHREEHDMEITLTVE